MAVNDWTLKTATVSFQGGFPSATYAQRGWCALAYDRVNQRMLDWEGLVNATYPGSIYSNTVYKYDPTADTLSQFKTTNWWNNSGVTTPLAANSTDPTPADVHPNFCYAEVSGTPYAYKFGGLNQNVQGQSTSHPEDFWRLNLNTGVWGQITASGSVPRWRAVSISMVWLESIGEILLLNCPATDGGSSVFPYLWNLSTNACTQLTGTFPGVFAGCAAVWDSRRNIAWIFGGGSYAAGGNELWFYDPATQKFAQVTQANSGPGARTYAGFAYSAERDVLMIQGGAAGAESTTYNSETWVYFIPTRTWTQLSPTNHPAAHRFNYMAYHEALKLFVCKTSDGTSGDWWTFDYAPTVGTSRVKYQQAVIGALA